MYFGFEVLSRIDSFPTMSGRSATFKGCDELCFDIQCAEKATKDIHALIFQPLHLEVLMIFWHLWVVMIYLCWDSDLYSCIDPSAATPGSARKFLAPKSDVMIYLLIFNVLRLWYIFMHWSFSHYIWKCSQFILAPTSDEIIYLLIFIVLRLWYIFMYWSFSCYI